MMAIQHRAPPRGLSLARPILDRWEAVWDQVGDRLDTIDLRDKVKTARLERRGGGGEVEGLHSLNGNQWEDNSELWFYKKLGVRQRFGERSDPILRQVLAVGALKHVKEGLVGEQIVVLRHELHQAALNGIDRECTKVRGSVLPQV